MHKHKGKMIIGGSVVLALALIWLGGGENRELQSVSPLGGGLGGNTAAVAATASSGSEAPDFTLESIHGGNIALSDYRGEKPVILDFFATWCPNCRRDMPRLSKWYEEYKDQVEVIGINLQEREGVVNNYIKNANISFPIALDPKAEAARSYGVRFTNYHVLIDKAGNIAGVVPGDINESQILSLIAGS